MLAESFVVSANATPETSPQHTPVDPVSSHPYGNLNPSSSGDDVRVTGCTGPTPANAILANVSGAISNIDLSEVGSKIDNLKKWSVKTFKNSRQIVFEHFGSVERTCDPEFDGQVEQLRDFHRRYGNVVTAARHFSAIFTQLIEAEKNMAEALYQLGLKESTVKLQCDTSGESLRSLANAATSLDSCLRYFFSSIETLHTRTIVDTLDTVNICEQARIEYDVARNELEKLQAENKATPVAIAKATELAREKSDKYERLKQDCRVKFRLLEGNRVEVLSKQLCKLQTALSAYFAGNVSQLENAVRDLSSVTPAQAQAQSVSFLTQ